MATNVTAANVTGAAKPPVAPARVVGRAATEISAGVSGASIPPFCRAAFPEQVSSEIELANGQWVD